MLLRSRRPRTKNGAQEKLACSGRDVRIKRSGHRTFTWAAVGEIWSNGGVFAGLLIEDYVRTLISLSESRGFGIGIAKGRRSRAPYQVAVLIGLEDVEGGNQL